MASLETLDFLETLLGKGEGDSPFLDNASTEKHILILSTQRKDGTNLPRVAR